MRRCPWAKSEVYVEYQDKEVGMPVHDDRRLFEFLMLEGAQAGLSWEIILRKRQNYREAFHQFQPHIIAKYDRKKRRSLLSNTGIVRNALKIDSAIQNAKAFVGYQPKQNAWKSIKEVPNKTPESDAMSKDLKKRGFKFVGSTICYACMHAVGMVNDHLVDCFRYEQL